MKFTQTKTKVLTNQKSNRLKEIELDGMHVEIQGGRLALGPEISSPLFSLRPGIRIITNQHIFPYCTLTHMTDLMTYPNTTSHISLKSQAFSHHGVIRRGAFRHGAHGDPRLWRQEDRDHAGLAAIDNEAVDGSFEK